MTHNNTVLSDPVHGFVKVPEKIIQPLLETREVQRLRRIKQLGMGGIVFPAAEHSRFPHSLGAMGLLSDALDNIESKGTEIAEEERMAALAAILLHDIGHSPYSHTLEFLLIDGVRHEEISLALIKRLQSCMEGPLDMAIQMLDGTCERPFFCDLISSQLDMDRLDYLRRDSHFTGVVEGKIGTGRILRTLCVHPQEGGTDSCLAIESKGVYAVENMLIARRLMYWQVYLHKTVIAADFVLHGAIRRASDRIHCGDHRAVDGISPALHWFLEQRIGEERLSENEVLDKFLDLDDADIIYSLKRWCHSTDPILSDLSLRIITRDLFRCTFLHEKPDENVLGMWQDRVTTSLKNMGITEPDAYTYYLAVADASHDAYKSKDRGSSEPEESTICVLKPSGELVAIDEYSDSTAIGALNSFVKKPYVCYLKNAELPL